jgi:hypothetical protein
MMDSCLTPTYCLHLTWFRHRYTTINPRPCPAHNRGRPGLGESPSLPVNAVVSPGMCYNICSFSWACGLSVKAEKGGGAGLRARSLWWHSLSRLCTNNLLPWHRLESLCHRYKELFQAVAMGPAAQSQLMKSSTLPWRLTLNFEP